MNEVTNAPHRNVASKGTFNLCKKPNRIDVMHNRLDLNAYICTIAKSYIIHYIYIHIFKYMYICMYIMYIYNILYI